MKLFVIFGAIVATASSFSHDLSHGYKVEVKHDIHHPQHYPIHYNHEPLIYEPEHHYDDHHHKEDYYTYPKYKFEYGVKDQHTGDHKSQWEIRDGDVVKGEYTLDEADGTKRIVSYEANDKTGFNAIVKKIGNAHHPEQHKKYGFGY